MNKRDIVIASLSHIETEIKPFHIDFTTEEEEKLNQTVSSGDYIKDAGVYLHYCQYWGWPTQLPDMKEHFLDEFGVTWNRSEKDKDIGVIDYPIISEPDISLWKEMENKGIVSYYSNKLS